MFTMTLSISRSPDLNDTTDSEESEEEVNKASSEDSTQDKSFDSNSASNTSLDQGFLRSPASIENKERESSTKQRAK